MLEHPSEYGARRELVEAVVRESYRLGWAHSELLSFAVRVRRAHAQRCPGGLGAERLARLPQLLTAKACASTQRTERIAHQRTSTSA